MRKVIAAINMTLDGNCDHNAVEPNADIHDHYAQLLQNAGVILYGRVTYQLMEFWKTLVDKPSGEKSMDNFAKVMDSVPKIVFTHTLHEVTWASVEIANQSLQETIITLKQQIGKPILIGSRSLLIQLLQDNLLDELQIMIHPVIVGKGMYLFEQLHERKTLELIDSIMMEGGAVLLRYSVVNRFKPEL